MKEDFLTKLRDRSANMLQFRAAAAKLSRIMASEIAEQLDCKKIILIPILRAGVALLPAFMERFEGAPIGFIGIQREEKTAIPRLYYQKLPPLSSDHCVLLLDPMVATGGSANLALDLLKKEGALHMILVSVIAAREGIRAVEKRHPHVRIYTVAIDEKLDAQKFIVPGLGDFGDRYFGSVSV